MHAGTVGWHDYKHKLRCVPWNDVSILSSVCMLNPSVMSNSLWPQAPLSLGFSRQEYWSGLQCPPPGDLPDPGVEPVTLAFPSSAGRFFTTSATLSGSHTYNKMFILLDWHKNEWKINSSHRGCSWLLWNTFLDPEGFAGLIWNIWSLEYREHITFLDLKVAHLSNGFMLPTSSIPLKCRRYPLGEVCRTLWTGLKMPCNCKGEILFFFFILSASYHPACSPQ